MFTFPAAFPNKMHFIQFLILVFLLLAITGIVLAVTFCLCKCFAQQCQQSQMTNTGMKGRPFRLIQIAHFTF